MRIFPLYILLLMLTIASAWGQQDSSRKTLQDTLALDEIVITNRVAVRITKDTVSYTVDSFNRNSDATTEDVLKRMPGVEVANDGSITVQGKPVTKLLINGKEFTAEDLRTITKNMPAEVLDKIQFADYYDEDAQFTGIKPNADKKIINLQFKKKYKGGMYGRAVAGYGNRDRYQAAMFFNYLTDSVRVTGIGNANNTGITDAARDGPDNTKAGARPQNGINARQSGNLNFSHEVGKRLKLNGSYDVSNTDNQLLQYIYRTTYLPGDSNQLRSQQIGQTSGTLHNRFNVRTNYKINELASLHVDGGVYMRKNANNTSSYDTTAYPGGSGIAFNRDAVTDGSGRGKGLNASINYRSRFKKARRTLSLFANINHSNDNGNGKTENHNTYYNPIAENTALFTSTDNKINTASLVGLRYAEPIGKQHILSVSYTYNYTAGRSERVVYAGGNGAAVKDTAQSRSFYTKNEEHPFSLSYQYAATQITANANIDMRPYYRYSELQTYSRPPVRQQGVNYAPGFSFRYDAGGGRNIGLSYNGVINTPDVNLLQAIPDYTDSLNIFIGNPGLRPEVNHNASLSYNRYETMTQRVFIAQLRAGIVRNKIINRTDITASRRTTTPHNANGTYNLGGLVSYTLPVISKKLKGTLALSGNYSNIVSFVNGSHTTLANSSIQPSVRVVYLANTWFDGDIYYIYRRNNVQQTTSNNLLQTHTVEHSGAFTIPGAIRLQYYLSYVYNDGLASTLERSFLLVNTSIDKSFTRPRGLIIKLQAFDIFNRYPVTTRITGDNYFEDRTVNRVGSYVIFAVVYKFSYFPASGK